MSKSITIRAADSALAMEEVVRQLGPEALILSTARRDGQFEIVAMVEEEAEAPAPHMPALAAKLAKSAYRDEAQKSEPSAREVRAAAPNTFEALLKRRLEEDKSATLELSDDAASVISPPPVASPKPVAATPEPAPAPQPQAQAQAQPLAQPRPVSNAKSMHLRVASDAPRAVPASAKEPSEPLFARYKLGGKGTHVANDPNDPSEAPSHRPAASKPPYVAHPAFTGLGALEISLPSLPDHVVDSFQRDLKNFDRSGELSGLSQAIVSSLLPMRSTEPMGAGRFWLAGPDMRHKALAAIRIATRKLDAGEAKPTFYVMGREARADAAFLASKAELLGLKVSLVDESVGRNLPDNVPGSQIVLLPDDSTIAKQYASTFQHDGDRGLLVLPTYYCHQRLGPLLADWAGMETQVMLCGSEITPVTAELVACLLQFNLQVGWSSAGEEILENLNQPNEVTVTDWMRAWVPATEIDAAAPLAAAVFSSAQFAAR